MKTIRPFLIAAIVMASTTLTSAQEKIDSIKVYYEKTNPHYHANDVEYYIDSVVVKNFNIEMLKPNDIAKINVVKGNKSKIYITVKNNVPYKFVSLQSLGDKYLKGKQTTGVLYTVNGKLILDTETMINEKDILRIIIASNQSISGLDSGSVSVVKVITKSELNIDNTNIRGNALGSL